METDDDGQQPMNLLKVADKSQSLAVRASNEKSWKKLERNVTKNYENGKNKKLQGFVEQNQFTEQSEDNAKKMDGNGSMASSMQSMEEESNVSITGAGESNFGMSEFNIA